MEVVPAGVRIDVSVFEVEHLLGVRPRLARQCAGFGQAKGLDFDPLRADGVAVDEGTGGCADLVGAQWVEIEAVRMADGSARSCAPRLDAEQVLYLEDGHIDARAGDQDFHLAPGDFLFLPRGAGVALRCPNGRRASGFLIKGRLPSSPSL